jgi:hypothetical protein
LVRFYGRRHSRHGVLVRLSTTAGTLSGLTVELRRGGDIVAKRAVSRVGVTPRDVVLRVRKTHVARGHYELVISARGQILTRRAVTVG